MAKPMPNPDAPQNRVNGSRLPRRTSPLKAAKPQAGDPEDAPAPADLDPWVGNTELGEEFDNLGLEGTGLPAADEEAPREAAYRPDDELEQLRLENTELRRCNALLEQTLEEARKLEEEWAERQREYEAVVEEKSEVIRELHHRLQEAKCQEAEQQAPERRSGPIPREDELL